MSIESFQRKMRAIPEAVRKATAPATAKGAEEIAALARQLAPVDRGDLKGSIAVTTSGQTTPAYSQPGGAYTVPEGAAVVTVGNRDVRYPHLQEFGTTFHAAQPFFWPAYRSLKKRTEARIKRALSAAIRAEWSK
jgi:HK97 gp10 family phage protein